MTDSVNHPSHYNTGKIEVIEFIEDKGLGFHLGNCIKYCTRAGKKDPAKRVEDLRKAKWYLERQIELWQSTDAGHEPKRPNDMKPVSDAKIEAIARAGLKRPILVGDTLKTRKGDVFKVEKIFLEPLGLEYRGTTMEGHDFRSYADDIEARGTETGWEKV